MAGQAQLRHTGLRPPRILILSASIGAGHDLPAEVMADELREREPAIAVKILDTDPTLPVGFSLLVTCKRHRPVGGRNFQVITSGPLGRMTKDEINDLRAAVRALPV